MRKVLFLLCVLAVIYKPTKVHASGNWLLNLCQSNEPGNFGLCIGFIAGAAHGIQFGHMAVADRAKQRNPSYPMICIPENVSNVQLRDIVIRYLHQYPQERHIWYVQLVADALWGAFPCRPR